MSKNVIAMTGKIGIMHPGTNKSWYTMRFVTFDPEKHFMSSDEAKEVFRKEMHVSKKSLAEDYICIYASKTIVGRGKNKHLEFLTFPGRRTYGADIIFVVPSKVKREAFKEIKTLHLPC